MKALTEIADWLGAYTQANEKTALIVISNYELREIVKSLHDHARQG